jgi:hypothetical protein
LEVSIEVLLVKEKVVAKKGGKIVEKEYERMADALYYAGEQIFL